MPACSLRRSLAFGRDHPGDYEKFLGVHKHGISLEISRTNTWAGNWAAWRMIRSHLFFVQDGQLGLNSNPPIFKLRQAGTRVPTGASDGAGRRIDVDARGRGAVTGAVA